MEWSPPNETGRLPWSSSAATPASIAANAFFSSSGRSPASPYAPATPRSTPDSDHVFDASQRSAARIIGGASPAPRRYEEYASKGIPRRVGPPAGFIVLIQTGETELTQSTWLRFPNVRILPFVSLRQDRKKPVYLCKIRNLSFTVPDTVRGSAGNPGVLLNCRHRCCEFLLIPIHPSVAAYRANPRGPS